MNRRILPALLILLLAAFTAATQKKSAIPDEMLDKMRARFYEIHNQRLAQIEKEKAEKEMAKTLEASVDEAMAKLKTWIANNQKAEAQLVSNYKPGYRHKPGEMNLFPVWEEIPAPIPSLPEAKQTNFDSKYKSYIDKVELLKKQLSDMEQEHLAQQNTSQSAMMQQSKDLANKNAVVQQMGGADAVMNMSEAERKAAAKNVKATAMNNPGAYSGLSDPGMKAMMQKMMTDPAYREKYNKMSDAEKQAELQKFMTNKTVERNDKAFEQSMKERDDAYRVQDVQVLLGKCLTNMQEAAAPYSEGTELANSFYNSLYEDIDRWYKKQYDALPKKVMGEMVEKEGLDQLNKYKAFLVYQVQKKEAVTRTILWSSLKARTKIAFGEFNDFIGNYPWGKEKNSNLIDGSYTEPQVAKAVYSIYEQMIQLAKGAETYTRRHKGQQEQFEIVMK